jgi:hypothetical protein
VEGREKALLREIQVAGDISLFDAIEIDKLKKAFPEFERIVKGGFRLPVARQIGGLHRGDPKVEGVAIEYTFAKAVLVTVEVEDFFILLDRLAQSQEKKDRKMLWPRK